MSRGWPWKKRSNCSTTTTPTSFRSAGTCGKLEGSVAQEARSEPRWVRGPRLVRVTGYGPLFDEGAYEQDGHIRIDFGTDTPFLEEDADLDSVGARHVEENVRQLVELTGGRGKGLGRHGAPVVERAGREPCAAAGRRLG